MNLDMCERWLNRQHPEQLRRQNVMAPECYLSDEPQVFLLLLIDSVRPNPHICKPCKIRVLEGLVKGASADNVYWNTVPNIIFPGEVRPVEKRLEHRLSMFGITADNNWGLDLADDELVKYLEPEIRALTLFHPMWEPLASAASDVCEYGSPQPWTGDKLEFMAGSSYTLKDLTTGRDLSDLVHLVSRILSRKSGAAECGCPLYSVLQGSHPDDFTPLEWPLLVLDATRQLVDRSVRTAWDESGIKNPMSETYIVSRDPDADWVGDWNDKFSRHRGKMHLPSGRLDAAKEELTPADGREDALRLFLLNDFDHLFQEFTRSEKCKRFCEMQGRPFLSAANSDICQAQVESNLRFGDEVSIYNGIGSFPAWCVDTKQTLRHVMNSSARRFWENEDDGTLPMENPDMWVRYL